MSIPFDRAVSHDDRTRALPAEAHRRFVARAVAELAGRPTEEIGLGTGRIALSLADAGVPIVGLDLSRPAAERFGGPAATESAATWHAYDVPADGSARARPTRPDRRACRSRASSTSRSTSSAYDTPAASQRLGNN